MPGATRKFLGPRWDEIDTVNDAAARYVQAILEPDEYDRLEARRVLATTDYFRDQCRRHLPHSKDDVAVINSFAEALLTSIAHHNDKLLLNVGDEAAARSLLQTYAREATVKFLVLRATREAAALMPATLIMDDEKITVAPRVVRKAANWISPFVSIRANAEIYALLKFATEHTLALDVLEEAKSSKHPTRVFSKWSVEPTIEQARVLLAEVHEQLIDEVAEHMEREQITELSLPIQLPSYFMEL